MEKAMDVVIVGGSIGGLMHGIMLKRLGHNVRILEQSTASIRHGHAAGIRISEEAQEFFKRFDLTGQQISLPVQGLRFLDANANQKRFIKNPTENTSWSTLYYRLRANFDGYTNPQYCPMAPEPPEGQGVATYELGKRVTEVKYVNGVIRLTCKNLIEGTTGSINADLAIAADGASSAIRSMVTDASREQETGSAYAGYVAWRGTVPEREATEETRMKFENAITFYPMKKSYILWYFHRLIVNTSLTTYSYVIPGQDGSLKPGERLLNWVWYFNHATDSEEFDEIMTDSDGHRHRNTLPEGKMNEKVWARQVSRAQEILNAPFIELVQKTKTPFISTVRDAMTSKASFFDGKLLLVGDALALFRPHCALSANQAALDCLALERVMKGEINVQQWEKQVLGYGTKIRALSTAIGNWYVVGGVAAIGSILNYFLIVLKQKLRLG